MRIAEIFSSIHGECNGHHQGRQTTFVRLSGCNLSCFYCDTPESQNDRYGKNWSTEKIISKVLELDNKFICITGGEPLLSSGIELILEILWRENHKISVETNGTIDITPYFRYVESFIVDFKCPSTGYENEMLSQNYRNLRPVDVVKFVAANAGDVKFAKEKMETLIEEQNCQATFAFSPVSSLLSPSDLYKLMEVYKIQNSILSVQIHKLIGLS